MSLGTKIKEALRGPHSPETAEGDQSVPGSFPTDDVSGSTAKAPGQDAATDSSGLGTSGSLHNKLHKRDDPRGWEASGDRGPGHTHTDSGVGLLTSDPSAHRDQGSAGHNIPRKTAPDVGHGSGTQAAATYTPGNTHGEQPAAYASPTHAYGQQSHQQQTPQHGTAAPAYPSDSSRPYTEDVGSGTTSGAGATAAASVPTTSSSGPDDKHNVPGGDRSTGDVVGKDPYWGDIPRGAGVYNTVTGHGSHEDDERHGQHQSSQHTHSSNAAAASLGTKNDATNQPPSLRASDHTSKEHREHSGVRDSAVPAGAAVGAGAAAYGLDKKHQQAQDEKNRGHESEPHRQEKEGAGSKLAGLFHRDHKDEKEKDHRHEHRHETSREEPIHHNVQQPHRDAQHTGFDNQDRTTNQPSRQPQQHASQVATEQQRQVPPGDKKHDHRKDEAAAAAAAAYAAHSASEAHGSGKDKREAEPAEKKESKLHALFHRSSKDKDDKPAKDEKHHTSHEGQHLHRQTEHHRQEQEQKPAAAGPIPSARHERTGPAADHDRSAAYAAIPDPSNAPAEDRKHDHGGAAVPLGLAAAGAGGYAAARHAGSQNEHQQPGPGQQPSDSFAPHQPTQHAAAASVSNISAAGTSSHSSQQPAAGVAPAPHHGRTVEERHGAPAPIHHGHGTTARQQGDFATPPSGTSALPVPASYGAGSSSSSQPAPASQLSTQPAGGATHGKPSDGASASTATAASHTTRDDDPSQGGRYNVLPSGTPSGVNIQGRHGAAGEETRPSDVQTTQGGHHSAAKYAAPAAAAAAGGAGAAYAATRGHGGEDGPAREGRAQPPAQTEGYGASQRGSHQAQATRTDAGSGPTGPVASGTVIHHCVKCGEANDITHYLNRV